MLWSSTAVKNAEGFHDGQWLKDSALSIQGPSLDIWSGNQIPYTTTKSLYAATKDPHVLRDIVNQINKWIFKNNNK